MHNALIEYLDLNTTLTYFLGVKNFTSTDVTVCASNYTNICLIPYK